MVKFALCQPSSLWGFLPSKGVGWQWAAPEYALLVSVDILVKLSPPALASILLGEPSQIVEGWLIGQRSREGWVDAIWLL